MAMRAIKSIPLTAIELVSKNDDALDLEKSDWEQYQKTGDLNHLKFVEGKVPTYFICNFDFKRSEAESVKNSMIGGKDDNGDAKVALGSWSFRIAQLALKDIKNPEDLPEDEKILYKKDRQGYAHENVILQLERMGVVNEIFSLYSALVLSNEVKANAKN